LSDKVPDFPDSLSDYKHLSDKLSRFHDSLSDSEHLSDKLSAFRDSLTDSEHLSVKVPAFRVKSIFMCTFIFSLCVFKPHLVSILILFTGEWYHSPVNKIFV